MVFQQMLNNEYVYDIETLKRATIVVFQDVNSEQFYTFEMSIRKNDLYRMLGFYSPNFMSTTIGFNNIGFDAQVMQFIIERAQDWHNLRGDEIANRIYVFVQKLIEEQKYKMKLPYHDFTVPQIDCFRILGLDNIARLTSLKSLQFNLDMPSVETMPIHHSVEVLSDSHFEVIEKYCKNDVKSTLIVYKLIQGDTDHKLHKGNNLLDIRADIKEEFGLECTNMSEIRLGDELMRHTYAKSAKMNIADVPRKGTFRKYIKAETCIPDFIKFKTPTLQHLLAKLKKTTFQHDTEWEQEIIIGKTKYIQGLGGLHSVNNNEIYKSNINFLIKTADVSLTHRRN